VKVKDGCNVESVVKVFSLADNNYSRNIQCLPALPVYWSHPSKNNGVHLNGTINWLAFRNNINSSVPVDKYVILSLDLSTETYTQLLPPPGFDNVLEYHLPKIVVLMDCLCFCHDFEKTHFVIWQMKDFGVQESWIRLFKISNEKFFKWPSLLPLYLSENGDTLILANGDKEAFIYNHRDKTIEKIGISNHILWSQAKDYVESLVSIH
jgi:F-box interacting protein